jgi:chromosome partitioning protein
MGQFAADGGMTATHAAHVIVVGNEKGGSGKSTIALHLAIGLLQLGFDVTVADFDERQQSLLRYLDNRRASSGAGACAMSCPRIYEPPPPPADSESSHARLERIDADLATLSRRTDFVVIDTPGSVTAIARLAHRFADTLVTPMNDSLIDLDVLARIAPGSMKVQGPSHYSVLVLEQRHRRLNQYGAGLDWIVLRNRVAPIISANNARVGGILEALAPKLGFRIAPGMSERVIYRELFLTGATVLDSVQLIARSRLTVSHIAARVEVRQLIEALWLPQVTREIRDHHS